MQETTIEEYFKPLDKEAEIILKMQLEGKEKTSEILKEIQEQALLAKFEAEKVASMHQVDNCQANQNPPSTTTNPKEL